MKVYHGSNTVVARPDVSCSRPNLDFGPGFYVTSVKSQAENWARRKALRTNKPPVVNVYEMAEVPNGVRFLRFDENDEAWVELVCSCRRGEKRYLSYDLIFGGVADDKVYAAVDLYYRGIWDIRRTIEELRFYEKNDQFCFVNQGVLDSVLRFECAYEVFGE